MYKDQDVDWLVVYRFTSRLRIFHSLKNGRLGSMIDAYGIWAAIGRDQCRAILIRTEHGTSVKRSHLKDPPPSFSRLLITTDLVHWRLTQTQTPRLFNTAENRHDEICWIVYTCSRWNNLKVAVMMLSRSKVWGFIWWVLFLPFKGLATRGSILKYLGILMDWIPLYTLQCYNFNHHIPRQETEYPRKVCSIFNFPLWSSTLVGFTTLCTPGLVLLGSCWNPAYIFVDKEKVKGRRTW